MDLRTSRAAVLLGALLASSTIGGLCAPDPVLPPPEPISTCADSEPPADGQPRIELSDPETGAPLEDGHSFTREYGQQGGSHIMVAVRQYAASAGTWTYHFELLTGSEEQIAGDSGAAVEACAPGWTMTISPVFLYDGTSTGQPRLRVTAESGGVTVTDEVLVNLD